MPSAAARSAHPAARRRSSGNSSVRPTIERPIVWSTPPANSGSSGNTSRFRNQPATTRRAPPPTELPPHRTERSPRAGGRVGEGGGEGEAAGDKEDGGAGVT